MAISFTPEQQKVIELHHCNILVSAAAGSGKTAVLVERIIRMVCDEEHPVDIDRLLIVTFTNAAAAEMRERIALGISAKLDEKPESEHIQKQAALLHNAQITTIDSFCLFLLRNHFNEIGLDPAFRVADEGEVKLMQQEVLQELIEDGYREGGESFRFCVEFFCHGGREKVLEQHILNLSRYAASFPFPEEWLLARKEDYRAQDAESVSGSHYGQYLLSYLQKMTAGCAEKLKRVGTLCEEPDGPYMYGELTEQETEQLERLAGCRSLSEFESRLPAVVFGRLPSKKDDSVSPVKRELAKKLRNEVKESLKKLEGRFFATPLELAAKQGYACMEPVGTLVDLVLEFDRRMGEKKQERKIIDFSDMEHFALKILLNREEGRIRPSAVALEYRQHFAEILIDEYQDSNLVQEYLLKAVSGEEEGRFNRFMVGDVKQSIYKFRLARPELFLEKYNTYCPEEGDCRRIDLAKNFRSRTQVVDAVNSVFSGIMSKDIGGIEYDERAALYPGAVYPGNEGCESELLLVEKPDSNAEENAKRLEARAIARKIKELMGSFQVTEKGSGSLRPVRYSDLVILLRTNSGWDEEFKQVLEDEGIPVYITSKTGYFGATEVQELLQLLRVLDNPTQDIPLFGVMKSVFGGFTEEEIARLRSGKKSCSLYEAVKEYVSDLEAAGEKPEEAEGESQAAGEKLEEAEGESQTAGEKPEEAEGESQAAGEKLEEAEDRMLSVRGNCSRGCGGLEDGKNAALCRKAADFITMLERYREYTAYMPIRELLATLVTDFDYLNYVTALPAGGKRRANVEMLFTKASDFEKTSYFGLFHFIRYMEQLEKYDVDYGEAELLDENADVVRIMSIHKSKGLEFPVTFVAGMSKRFNIQDANQSMIADMDMGLATDYVDPERRLRNRTLRRAVLSVKLREDNLSEELRVLYVALTRAKEKLVMTASMENAREQWELWKDSGSERLAFLDYAEAGSYLDFLLPVLAKTCIRVSVINGEELEADAFKEQMSLHERKTRLEQAGKRIGKQTAVETEKQVCQAAVETEKQVCQAAVETEKQVCQAAVETERQVCQTAVETEKQVCQTETEEQVYQALKERLRAVYAYENLSGLYTKTTVSELKIAAMADKDEAAYHTFEEKEVQPYIPLFRREQEKVSGTVRGNAYHRVMEILDLDLLMEAQPGEERKAALHGFLTEQVEENRLDKEYFEAVREEKILRFLSSELGRRMYRAHREGGLFREQPFVIGIGADRLGQGFPEAETVLIQGIIDVFFVEEDGLVLLDYKTDSVRSMAELWNRYEAQMNYYQEALQKLMCRPVKERILYSFSLEKY